MALKYRQKVLLAKLEATSSTAETLAKADAILAAGIEITPLAGETTAREIEYAYYGHAGDIPINTHQQISFKIELAGAGAAGTAPAWGPLLQACAFAETISAGAKVEYNPITGAEKSLTIGINIAGQLHTMQGCRGTFTLELSSNAIPYINFTFTGQWTDPAAAQAVSDPVYTGFKKPQIASNRNTPTFSFLGSSALSLTEFAYDHGNSVIHREVIGGANEVLITGRAPTGSVTFDTPAFSALNLPKKARDGDTGTLQLIHGTAAGNIIQFGAPKIQLSAPSYADSDGIWQVQAAMAFVPSGGNDEFKITVK